MKKLICFIFALSVFASTSFGQSGQKFASNGNSLSTGEFLGSTNNFPLNFRVANIQKMSLGVNGVLQLNGLSGSGNRLLQTDANGNILPFNMGLSNQYLSGNGTWVNFPTIPTVFWQQSGSGIFYNGNVGINNPHPQFALDITGDLNVTNNVFVGGAVLIGQKIKAIEEVHSPILYSDSIVPKIIALDASRQITGQANFLGDVSLANKLNVNGNAIFSGNLKATSLQITGNSNFSQISVLQDISAPQLTTSHIRAADTSGIHLGDSSMVFLSFPAYENMRASNPSHGLSVGSAAKAGAGSIAVGYGSNAAAASSFAFGWRAQTNPASIGAIALGVGINNNSPMANNIPYSLAVGLNSDIPTFFVSGGNGNSGSLGMVGIGTTAPAALLEVSYPGGSSMRIYGNSFGDMESTSSLRLHYASNTDFGIYEGGLVATSPRRLVIQNGNVGINYPYANNGGTGIPYRMLTVNGDVSFANYSSSGVNPNADGLNGIEILGADQIPTRRGIATDNDPNGDLNFYINSNQASAEFKFKNGQTNTTLLTVDAVGATTINNVAANSIPLTINHVNGSTFKILANGAGDISSTGDFRPHFATGGDYSIYEGTPGSGILHFDIQGTSGQTTVRTTDAQGSNDAFIVQNYSITPATMTGGDNLFAVKNNGLTTINSRSNTNALVVNDILSGTSISRFLVHTNGNIEMHPTNISSTNNVIDVFDNSGVSRFRVKSTGFVYAREVTIQTGFFPDYVFDKKYDLKSIPAVAVFIEKNKHLPGFESADHYVKNGINSSEMFVKQQEKIEELMLYIIELEKRIKKLETNQN